jgi:hypothetical protein
MAYLHGSVKSHNDQDVRGVLHHVSKMAEDTGAAIVIVRHLNKSAGGNSLYRGGGSIGIIGAARSGLVIAKDPENDERRILARNKGNLGPEPKSRAFRLESVGEYTRVVWDGTSDLNAAELLVVQFGDSNELVGERQDTEDFIRNLLIRGLCRKAGTEASEAAGITVSTLRRAAKRLGVHHGKQGGCFGRGAGRGVYQLKLLTPCLKMLKMCTFRYEHLKHLQSKRTSSAMPLRFGGGGMTYTIIETIRCGLVKGLWSLRRQKCQSCRRCSRTRRGKITPASGGAEIPTRSSIAQR